MTDWLEEEEKAEKTNNFHDRFQDVLISAGIIPTSSSDIFPPSPKTLLQMKELTDNIQYLHISTPKSPKKSETNQIKDTQPPPPPSEKLQLPIFHLRPPPEMHQNQPPPPPPPPERNLFRERKHKYSERYERILKIHWAKEKFPNFLALFSEKEWEEGIPTQTFRLRFINFFNFSISNQGLGRLKEVQEFCILKRKKVNGKIKRVYKKRLNK